MAEKGLPTFKPSKAAPRSLKSLILPLCLLSVGYLSYTHVSFQAFSGSVTQDAVTLKNQCIQVAPLFPKKTTAALDEILDVVSSSTYKNQSIKYLSNAVRIPTISYDKMSPPGEDVRWEIFYEFAEYLKVTFPLVHESLTLEKINTHGLLYTWQGSKPSLKPTLLMAHQDVVPVPAATIPTWTHPTFSGHYDGKAIWGRGSSDDKNQLIAIFEAVELLLQASFAPERTVLISLGFDEESAGTGGAGSIAKVLYSRYGAKSIATIVDEGSGISEIWGHTFASPGVSEKGSINVVVTIRMPGGHSSVPPPHTSIGVISELIYLIEADTYPTYLDSKNPYYSQLVCGAAYAEDFPEPIKKLLPKSSPKSCHGKDVLAEEAAKESLFAKYLMTTSIAVDIVTGGEKSNALPEESTIAHIAQKVASKHNLTLNAYTGKGPEPSSITLSAPHLLEVAPVTPTSIDNTTAYSVLSGTIRALYGEDMVVSPGLMTGNTDTRFFWELSDSIFRFAPGYSGGSGKSGVGKIHTVDESVDVENHFSATKWFVLFLRNMDEAGLL